MPIQRDQQLLVLRRKPILLPLRRTPLAVLDQGALPSEQLRKRARRHARKPLDALQVSTPSTFVVAAAAAASAAGSAQLQYCDA
eukprot:6175091-Pleurochrysis_carterae.AAC.3